MSKHYLNQLQSFSLNFQNRSVFFCSIWEFKNSLEICNKLIKLLCEQFQKSQNVFHVNFWWKIISKIQFPNKEFSENIPRLFFLHVKSQRLILRRIEWKRCIQVKLTRAYKESFKKIGTCSVRNETFLMNFQHLENVKKNHKYSLDLSFCRIFMEFVSEKCSNNNFWSNSVRI